MASGTAVFGACRGSESLTSGVRVRVTPEYEAYQSLPQGGNHVFSYRILISNESDRRVQLLCRRWVIIDSDGDREVVEGDGVVGEQPVIEPGESYQYGSWCRLATEWGTMEGSYEMHAEPGETLRVTIGRFYLVAEAANANGD
ncbi:MAG: Co2+/Mg2+ efflux protein ApaG [Planctomycetota bacterium]